MISIIKRNLNLFIQALVGGLVIKEILAIIGLYVLINKVRKKNRIIDIKVKIHDLCLLVN